MRSHSTAADTPPQWPGDRSSVTLRAEWYRLRARVERLEAAAGEVTRELAEARATLARLEALAGGGRS